jgi:YD repeat-containing protein
MAGAGTLPSPVLSYSYDGDNNLVTATDALGNVTSYAFDAAQRELSERDPNPSTGSSSGGPLTSYTF